MPVATPNASNDPTLWDNGLPDGRNGLSCTFWAAYPLDREVVDDFNNTEPWTVTDGHFRIVTNSGGGPEMIQGVNVFFYQGAKGPFTTRFATRTATFAAYLTGAYYFGRPEIAVDCSFDPVNLTAGTWWVCFQPVLDDNCFWLTTVGSGSSVYVSYPDIVYPKWTFGYNVFGAYYDVSFRLTGTTGGPSEIVIDDSDPGFLVYQGAAWPTRSYADAVNGSTHFRLAGTGSNIVAWRADNVVPQAGQYDVYVWKFDHPRSGQMATNAHYYVQDVTGLAGPILVDQSTSGDAWVLLGNYRFDSSSQQGVGLSDAANGAVIADAVKLVYTGP